MRVYFLLTGLFFFFILLLGGLFFLFSKPQEEKIIFEEFEKEEVGLIMETPPLCGVSGCNGELCVNFAEKGEMDDVSSCVFKEEYTCYKEALCQRQESGECAWTMTENLSQCLEKEKTSLQNTQEITEDSSEKALVNDENFSQEEKKEEKTSSLKSLKKEKRLITWGYEKSNNRSIDTLIIHSSYNSLGGDEYDVEAIIAIYKTYEVGAHYIIDRKGKILQLIEEENIAYHAGVSQLPDGRTKVNAVSLGIEMVGNLRDGFSSEQYRSLNKLIGDIQSRYGVRYILGHNEIAPERKTDPWNINWDDVDR
ncbi:MAG: hypothetical protein EOM19_03025 [Candidatus Moranbacteria bacterium]|nr:hypothetical protein [Candidatus Moranbacteria bacterium]